MAATIATIYEQLSSIQKKLKTPKNQYNSFGNYNYRSCEDILEAVKPLLNGLVLTLNDEICQVGERYYVKATVSLSDGKNTIMTSAYAREGGNRKGMDDSQLTGACSSYARKYALNGLFCIDDEKDADTRDNTKEDKKPVVQQEVTTQTSKIILYDALTKYCTDQNGTVDKEMMSTVLQDIAVKKDKTSVKSWDELKNVDGEKYEKWFALMLKKFRER